MSIKVNSTLNIVLQGTVQGMLNPDEFMHVLEAEVQRRKFSNHPFVGRVAKGDVTIKQLQGWAKQFFLQVREFPRWVGAVYANCPDREVRRFLLMNLVDEEGTNKPHPEVFLRFGKSLGLSREEMENAEPLPETTAFIDRHRLISMTRPFYEGIAATGVGLESQVPEGFKIIYDGFRSHLKLTVEDVEFFYMHMGGDEEHGQRSKDIVRKYATTEEAQKGIRDAVAKSLASWWNLFEGSYKAYFK